MVCRPCIVCSARPGPDLRKLGPFASLLSVQGATPLAPLYGLFLYPHQKGTGATAVVTQPTSLGHFVPKSRVWGGSPTSIFDGPRPVKNGKCGHTCPACRLCISCKLRVLRHSTNLIPLGQYVPKPGRCFSKCCPLFMPGGILADTPNRRRKTKTSAWIY